ncbi:hypothetical protein ACLB2K_001016 [Fragaria x ananassa]
MLKRLSSSSSRLHPRAHIQPHHQTHVIRLCSTIPISENPTSNSFNLPLVSDLIANQRWSELKTHLKDSTFITVLHQLLDFRADPELIRRYLNWAQAHNAPTNIEITCKLLQTLSNAKKYPKMRAFLDDFVRRNEKHSVSSIFHMLLMCNDQFCVNSVIVDMLVWAYVKNSKTNLGLEAFQRAGDYGFRLSTLSCNALLSALVKENEFGYVEFVYKEMIRRRIAADLYSFNIVINGLCKVGKLNKAKDVMDDMKAWGVAPNVVTYNTIIGGYYKLGGLGKMHKADAMLKEMVLMPYDDVAAAFKVFEEMRREGLKPNVVTYNSLINGLCCDGRLEEACGLRDEMLGLGLKPEIATYNALINGFCKKKMLKEARELFDTICERGLVANVITFNTLIDGYCKNEMEEEAYALHNMMIERRVFPNTSTFNCLIAGSLTKGNIETAKKFLQQMEAKGVKADCITYDIRIDALCQDGEPRKAERLLNEMFTKGLSPRHVTYNTLMDGYCREGNLKAALNLRARMEKEGKRANIATYNVLIKGYCMQDKLVDANELLNEMLEKGLIPNRTTYEIVKVEMMDKGFVPDIDGHLHNISSS